MSSKDKRNISPAGKILLNSNPKDWQDLVFEEGKKKEVYEMSGDVNSFNVKKESKIIKINLAIDLFLCPGTIKTNLIVNEIGFEGKVLALEESRYKALDNLFSSLISIQLKRNWLLSGHIISPSGRSPVPITIIHKERRYFYEKPYSYYAQGQIVPEEVIEKFLLPSFRLN